MQLFISSAFTQEANTIRLSDNRILHQCYTVLRMKENDEFMLQAEDWELRYTISISTISKKEIIWHISHTESLSSGHNNESEKVTLCIALPNRMDKAELIVQKLSEIGIKHILFFPASRSLIRELKEKTLMRLHTIAVEAVEQSFGHQLPSIEYKKSLDSTLQNPILWRERNNILFDHHGISREECKKQKATTQSESKNTAIYTYIWPEWWFNKEEKEKISENINTYIVNLWTTNLRMETAAIISWRLLQN